MNSSEPSAADSRAPFGVLSTGLPAMVMSARIWPVARRLDLLGEAADRQLPEDLGQPADAARPPSEADALAASGLAARVRSRRPPPW